MIYMDPTLVGSRGSNQTMLPESAKSPNKHVESAELDPPCLPTALITGSQIDEAKRFLTTEQFGISYAHTLSSIDQEPWLLSAFPHRHSLEITHKLIKLHPGLLQVYQNLASSEGILTLALSLIPFIGLPSPSTQFLKANEEINRIFGDLKKAGLSSIRHIVQPICGGGGRQGVPYLAASSLWIVSATELGKLALQAHLEVK
jgi:hypothetical protein